MKRFFSCCLLVLMLATPACSYPENTIPTTVPSPSSKTFTVTEFSIELTRDFYQKESSSLLVCRSEDFTVTVHCSPFADYEGSGLSADATAAQWARQFASPAFGGTEPEEKDGLVFLTKSVEENGVKYLHRQFCFRGGEGFYSVTFAAKESTFTAREDAVSEFAKSVRFRSENA